MSIMAVEIQPIGPMAEWSIAVASKPIYHRGFESYQGHYGLVAFIEMLKQVRQAQVM